MFRDGDEVHLQSRNGKPMNRYFPEIEEQVRALPGPAAGARRRDGHRGGRRPGVRPALPADPSGGVPGRAPRRRDARALVAFDLLAEDDELLLDLPYDERRERLAAIVADPVQLTPVTADRKDAGQWLTGLSEGVVAKEGGAPYRPGERTGMVKVKRVRTADVVVAAFRFGKEEGTVGSLILGLYDDDGQLHVVGHTSGFKASQKRELLEQLEPYRTGERGSGEPSRWKSDEELVWEGLRPGARLRDRLRPHHRATDPPRSEVSALAHR